VKVFPFEVPQCDYHHGPALRVFYMVRTFRTVEGKRTCFICMRRPEIKWLVRRAYWSWLSDEVL
jgi:hypothetical protein